jgi:hypothetical protein
LVSKQRIREVLIEIVKRLRSIFPGPIHWTPILELGVRAAANNLRAAIRISEKKQS